MRRFWQIGEQSATKRERGEQKNDDEQPWAASDLSIFRSLTRDFLPGLALTRERAKKKRRNDKGPRHRRANIKKVSRWGDFHADAALVKDDGQTVVTLSTEAAGRIPVMVCWIRRGRTYTATIQKGRRRSKASPKKKRRDNAKEEEQQDEEREDRDEKKGEDDDDDSWTLQKTSEYSATWCKPSFRWPRSPPPSSSSSKRGRPTRRWRAPHCYRHADDWQRALLPALVETSQRRLRPKLSETAIKKIRKTSTRPSWKGRFLPLGCKPFDRRLDLRDKTIVEMQRGFYWPSPINGFTASRDLDQDDASRFVEAARYVAVW